MKGIGTLYGILVTAACMALATAISLACLSKSDAASRQAYAQDAALCEVQTAADLASSYMGDMDRIEYVFGGDASGGILSVDYGRDMSRAHGGTAAYRLELGPVRYDGLLGSCPAILYDTRDGGAVFGVTATWQADTDAGEEARP